MKQKYISFLLLFITVCFTFYSTFLSIKPGIESLFPTGTTNQNKANYNKEVPASETLSTIQLHAKAACLIDAESGRVLYGKNQNDILPMASTTKIMTCIVALEKGKPDDVVTVSKYASSMPDVQLNMKQGNQFYLKDLLYSLMLESHNDSAVAIAEHIGGSVEGFAKLMNEKATELGCTNTNFVTPNGLDAENHKTTAKELALIARYAIKNESFLNLISTPSWSFKEINKGKTYSVSNKDAFLTMYDGSFGIKTGFTNDAGFCFVGGVKRDGKTYISTVLASGWPPNKSYKWSDTKKLMDFGVKNFLKTQIFDSKMVFNPVPVKNGTSQEININCSGDLECLFSKYDSVRIEYHIPDELSAPLETDVKIGTADYFVNGECIGSFPVFTSEAVNKKDFKYCLKTLIQFWLP